MTVARPAISEVLKSAPQLLLYHVTIPELTLKPPLNSPANPVGGIRIRPTGRKLTIPSMLSMQHIIEAPCDETDQKGGNVHVCTCGNIYNDANIRDDNNSTDNVNIT